jgi:hypothetical protein
MNGSFQRWSTLGKTIIHGEDANQSGGPIERASRSFLVYKQAQRLQQDAPADQPQSHL